MAYTNFENGVTPINDTSLNNMQKGIVELLLPVGSTYITQSDTNPSTILQFGTWERLKGKVCVGLDENDSDNYFDEIGKTGGEKKHTQTEKEMFPHNHSFARTNSNIGSALVDDGSSSSFGAEIKDHSGYNAKSSEMNKTGGGQPFNVTQPYEVVGYMWIRRS